MVGGINALCSAKPDPQSVNFTPNNTKRRKKETQEVSSYVGMLECLHHDDQIVRVDPREMSDARKTALSNNELHKLQVGINMIQGLIKPESMALVWLSRTYTRAWQDRNGETHHGWTSSGYTFSYPLLHTKDEFQFQTIMDGMSSLELLLLLGYFNERVHTDHESK